MTDLSSYSIPNMGSTDVPHGTSPFYTKDSTSQLSQTVLSGTPVGPGSGMDADSIQGILAVTATVAGPNKLVATDKNGKLPLSIIPFAGGGGGVLGFTTGTYANLKATPPSGISFAIATDIGPAGALFFYFNNASIGDNGWMLISGS